MKKKPTPGIRYVFDLPLRGGKIYTGYVMETGTRVITGTGKKKAVLVPIDYQESDGSAVLLLEARELAKEK